MRSSRLIVLPVVLHGLVPNQRAAAPRTQRHR
jgi:hypothetical protein